MTYHRASLSGATPRSFSSHRTHFRARAIDVAEINSAPPALNSGSQTMRSARTILPPAPSSAIKLKISIHRVTGETRSDSIFPALPPSPNGHCIESSGNPSVAIVKFTWLQIDTGLRHAANHTNRQQLLSNDDIDQRDHVFVSRSY